MSPELVLLKGLLQKPQFRDYRPFIGDDVFKSEEHKFLLEIIDDEHGKNDQGDVSLDALVIRAKLHLNRYPALQVILDQLVALNISDAVYDEVFETIKQRNLANEIALKAIGVTEGRESFDDLIAFVDGNKSTKVASVDDVNILNLDISTYEEEKDGDDCLHWRLTWLNKSLGPIRKGNLGHVFANPEVGKTAFWVSEVTWMAQSAKRPIVVFFNEEQGKEVVYRMYSSMLGIPYKQIITDKAKYSKQFMDLGGNKIIFVDQAPLRTGFMERIMAKYKPCFAVIDNADKIAVKSMDRRDLEIHAIYKWARELAKEYCPILTVAHADASAYGTKYLNESMMANSKVGKPAEMDFIIGIGREEGEDVARYLSLPKNKLRGDNNTVEQLRHGHWAVALNTEISRFVDTVNEK